MANVTHTEPNDSGVAPPHQGWPADIAYEVIECRSQFNIYRISPTELTDEVTQVYFINYLFNWDPDSIIQATEFLKDLTELPERLIIIAAITEHAIGRILHAMITANENYPSGPKILLLYVTSLRLKGLISSFEMTLTRKLESKKAYTGLFAHDLPSALSVARDWVDTNPQES